MRTGLPCCASAMSLGIAIKGPEGVVLAADSRVTLLGQMPAGPGGLQMVIPSTFDHATKLLRVRDKDKKQNHVAAITFGAGAIGQNAPRTARSYMPEFEENLRAAERMSVKTFADELSAFFLERWTDAKMPTNLGQGHDMFFYVGGYDEGQAYGQVLGFSIPTVPAPTFAIPENEFGAAWGGQREVTDRIVQGFDPKVPDAVGEIVGLPPDKRDSVGLDKQLRTKVSAPIPWQFLPLQDSVDLAMFLIRATISFQRFTVGIRGVGGATDIVAITRDGVEEIQAKHITGEREHPTGRSRRDV